MRVVICSATKKKRKVVMRASIFRATEASSIAACEQFHATDV